MAGHKEEAASARWRGWRLAAGCCGVGWQRSCCRAAAMQQRTKSSSSGAIREVGGGSGRDAVRLEAWRQRRGGKHGAERGMTWVIVGCSEFCELQVKIMVDG